jgi:hypothetical protein
MGILKRSEQGVASLLPRPAAVIGSTLPSHWRAHDRHALEEDRIQIFEHADVPGRIPFDKDEVCTLPHADDTKGWILVLFEIASGIESRFPPES